MFSISAQDNSILATISFVYSCLSFIALGTGVWKICSSLASLDAVLDGLSKRLKDREQRLDDLAINVVTGLRSSESDRSMESIIAVKASELEIARSDVIEWTARLQLPSESISTKSGSRVMYSFKFLWKIFGAILLRVRLCLGKAAELSTAMENLDREVERLERDYRMVRDSSDAEIIVYGRDEKLRQRAIGRECLLPLGNMTYTPARNFDESFTFVMDEIARSPDLPVEHMYNGVKCVADVRKMSRLHGVVKNRAVEETRRIYSFFHETVDESDGILQSWKQAILPCVTVLWNPRLSPDMLLLLRCPSGASSPRTLRAILHASGGNPQHSLDQRVNFAIRLARSILFIQKLNLVHKNIRPENIAVFESDSEEPSRYPQTLGTPFLIGFGIARSENIESGMSEFERRDERDNFYRHPRHLMGTREAKWEMRDDVFSLGVCLFEIGLWRSMFKASNPNEIDDIVLDVREEAMKSRTAIADEYSADRDWLWTRREEIIQAAKERVSITMGEKFADIVVRCLTFRADPYDRTPVVRGRRWRGGISANVDEGKNETTLFAHDILSKLYEIKSQSSDDIRL